MLYSLHMSTEGDLHHESTHSRKNPMRSRRVLGPTFLGIVALGFVYMTQGPHNMEAQVNTENEVPTNTQPSEEIAEEIIEKVGKHILLPENSTPTVAEIIDVELLKEKNSFYDQASKGDFLVVTPTLAILYNPRDDQILNVVPISLEQNQGGN